MIEFWRGDSARGLYLHLSTTQSSRLSSCSQWAAGCSGIAQGTLGKGSCPNESVARHIHALQNQEGKTGCRAGAPIGIYSIASRDSGFGSSS